MELKVSSPKPVFSPSDCNSNPEEKEISEEDDDDRNHKHRRRESRSQSSEAEARETVLSRPFSKRNKPFENRHPYHERGYHSSDTRFEKRQGMGSFARTPLDSYQRMRPNQSGDAGPGRGRGRQCGGRAPCESRFQLVPQGPVTPLLFTGRGTQNVSCGKGSHWSAYGMVPGIPNGGLDTLHTFGLQGTLGTSLNIRIPRQRCRDFEERGFCLSGDMCPLEHGVNRIVVEDVQSLSQFNLPVSLPSAPMLGPATTQGSLAAIGPSSSLASGKALHNKSINPPVIDDELSGEADFYDPDQPLWSNDHPETSAELLDVNRANLDDTGPVLGEDFSDQDRVGPTDGFDSVKGAGATSGSQSVWRRISCPKNNLESSSSTQGVTRQGEQTKADSMDPQMMESFSKPQSRMRKPSQKALHTLFVRGIPQKDNKPEALLSHFKKFGAVIDIYIPVTGERAFVQFSKREEAEAALKAPDAVMGNRFIKLFWANRDSIMDNGVSGGSNLPLNPRGRTPSTVPPHPLVPYKGKDNLHPVASKLAEHSLSDMSKPVAQNGLKTTPALQKQLESLELLKEEMRKKQEVLEQKRNEFRLKLEKLEKQAVRVKDETVPDQAVKKLKGGGTVSNSDKVESSSSTEPNNTVSSSHAEPTADCGRCKENAEPTLF